MSEQYTTEISGIITAFSRDSGNRLCSRYGFGDCFTVPLSLTGADPPTHYGFHAWARPSFMTAMRQARTDNDPDKIDRREDKRQARAATDERSAFELAYEFEEGDFFDYIAARNLKIALPVEPAAAPDPVTRQRPI